MADALIESEIEKTKDQIFLDFKEDLSNDRVFSYVAVNNYFRTGELAQLTDIHPMITDGANDGGIDFVYLDDDKPAVVVGQSKYVSSIQIGEIVAEIRKMRDSVIAFRSGHGGFLNKDVQRELRESLDALPDDYSDAIEYVFFTVAKVDEKGLLKKIQTSLDGFEVSQFTLVQGEDLVSAITQNMEEVDVVKEDYVVIDSKNNVLKYVAPNGRRGAFVNVSSESIIRLYQKYIDRGLLSLNIRGFIRNKSIDTGINDTLNKERDNFWFYNNGLTIACSDFWADGNRIKMTDFSIVNGGQTTTLIGKYSGSNADEFFIPCKIIAHQSDEDPQRFFTRIAEATNSQKPIKPRDLKSNSPEMHRLKKWLLDEGVFLEIKRGDRRGRGSNYLISNETLGQLMLSFVFQQPGVARSGKRTMWESVETYNKLFRQSYENSPNKKAFILDLIDLYKRYYAIDKQFKTADSPLTPSQKDALKNGTMAIFALMGALYDIVNGDIDVLELKADRSILDTHDFEHGAFISNYHADDIDDILKELIEDLTTIVLETYEKCVEAGKVTSMSNLLKTDRRYRDEVLMYLLNNYDRMSGKNIRLNAEKLFKRSGNLQMTP